MSKKKKVIVEQPIKRVRFKHWDKVALGVLVIGTFLLRVLPQLGKVFVDGNVWFRGVDSWYHMRLVDNMVANFPAILGFDMYATYPGGFHVGFYPLFGWIIAGISKLGFNPNVVGAFLPPILGALLLVPVYFLGKELFSKGIGIVACLLVMVMPGELFHRSLLGFTDQHILETFLMVTTILFLVLAYRYGKKLYIAGAGISLGLYCLNWHGAAFFVVILGVWFLVEVFRNKEISRLCKLVPIVSGTAFVMLLPYFLIGAGDWRSIAALGALMVAPLVLLGLTHVLSRKVLVWGLGTLLVLGLVVLFSPLRIGGLRLTSYFGITSVFWGLGAHIEEATPTFPGVALSVYGVPIILFFLGLFYTVKRRVSWLFVVWAVILLVATIGQRRWGYYFTVPVALLASYAIFEASRWIKKDLKTAAIVVSCFFLIIPSVKTITGLASLPNNITEEWYSACTWLRENTEEPFGEDAYYKLSVEGAGYGVLAWWDYGHWIIKIGHRVPIASPTNQEVAEIAGYLMAQNEEDANKAIDGLDIRYVMVSKEEVTGKFYSLVKNAELPIERQDELLPNSMVMRLWLEQAETWKKIHQEGDVKIYERS